MNDRHRTCKLHMLTRYGDFEGKRRQIKIQTEYTALDSILEVRHEPKHLLLGSISGQWESYRIAMIKWKRLRSWCSRIGRAISEIQNILPAMNT